MHEKICGEPEGSHQVIFWILLVNKLAGQLLGIEPAALLQWASVLCAQPKGPTQFWLLQDFGNLPCELSTVDGK